MIYEFKITLNEAGIPIWRTIQMDSNATCHDLHRVIQVVFDWDNYHLHSFSVQRSNGRRMKGVKIEPRSESGENYFWDGEMYDEDQVQLSDWFKMPHDKMRYTYDDFVDDWRHDVVLSKIMQPEKGVLYPRCIGAEYVTPEEDSGFQEEIDLDHPHPEVQVKEINDNIHKFLSDMLAEVPIDIKNHWEEVLSKAKRFHRLNPWKWMDDRHIFVVVDPITKEKLFCSILGAEAETFGLAIYIGKDGFRILEHILDESADYDKIAMNQRCLLLSFEDRQDLDKADYALIKTYGIPFRGKKPGRSFAALYRVMRHGFWMMKNHE
ncbi:plasmid pRiA4b ORF-3 family protein [Virgibacillus sp. 179-BFC.A HS]|uniref:Plasmid pRiA4b ORF-3 family protein n=1 Tax=Tigheibacillus jepli TaxID=3035914 RepID=A0ABU5CLB5_9BACI|nr:plasmid pRiA4b ORF-3 family protein [Virgibacillus sp. 179-BFC.A HS]MDY0407152.1 plasmid pRiA4b ORF-3 family protein [Virgibacillus sp. 179-BFC.A HS]